MPEGRTSCLDNALGVKVVNVLHVSYVVMQLRNDIHLVLTYLPGSLEH